MKPGYMLYLMQKALAGSTPSEQRHVHFTAVFGDKSHFERFLHSVYSCCLMDIKVWYAQLDRVISSSSSQRKLKRCQNDYFKLKNLDFSQIHLAFHCTTRWALIRMVSTFITPSMELIL